MIHEPVQGVDVVPEGKDEREHGHETPEPHVNVSAKAHDNTSAGMNPSASRMTFRSELMMLC